MKLCPSCKIVKEFQEFTKDYRRPDGYRFYCIECQNKKNRSTYSSSKTINRKRIARYGINSKDYDKLFELQEGKCKICLLNKGCLCIDHDHKTGKIRGLLCRRCNGFVGRSDERLKDLLRAVEHIRSGR